MGEKPKVIPPIGGTLEEKIDAMFVGNKKIREIREQETYKEAEKAP